MAAVDPAMQSAHRRAIEKTGELVTIARLSGTAPRTVSFSAQVYANVQKVVPDQEEVAQTGYGSNKPGAITQNDRMLIVMVDDLANARFPLPVKKNDKIVLENGGRLSVVEVDAHKRQIAGAIEIRAAGVT